ncbi:MAG: hypothetical protein C6H99_04725 [Epsilonproteobacteria bacterium]|nr:hypothetical protein [Campylobacterota bacterium]
MIESKDPSKRGYKSVIWGPNDTMVGPYKDAKSPFHKTKQGEHFLQPNKLCFVCHYNGDNQYGVLVYETGMEYEQSGSKQSCVECHMSKKRERRVADVPIKGYVPKIREVRDHFFMGARNGDILTKALNIDVKEKNHKLIVTLQNRTPHRVPTGFAGREVVVEISFWKDKNLMQSVTKSLTTKYLDEKGRVTVPYLGIEKAEDNRIMPNEKRAYEVQIPQGVDSASIAVYYRLVNKDLQKLLKIDNEIFARNYEIVKVDIDL